MKADFERASFLFNSPSYLRISSFLKFDCLASENRNKLRLDEDFDFLAFSVLIFRSLTWNLALSSLSTRDLSPHNYKDPLDSFISMKFLFSSSLRIFKTRFSRAIE